MERIEHVLQHLVLSCNILFLVLDFCFHELLAEIELLHVGHLVIAEEHAGVELGHLVGKQSLAQEPHYQAQHEYQGGGAKEAQGVAAKDIAEEKAGGKAEHHKDNGSGQKQHGGHYDSVGDYGHFFRAFEGGSVHLHVQVLAD